MELQIYTDEQVTRIVDGAVQYGYKIIGTIDPNPNDILWLNEGDVVDPLFEEYTMRMTTKGTRSGESPGNWATCYICRYEYPTVDMILKGGKYYCTKQNCADDLVEVLK